MYQHSFTVNIVTLKSASLHIAVAMIYKNSVLSFYWCPSHQCAKPDLAAAVTSGCSVLWGTKMYSTARGRDCQVLFCHEKIKANKSAFWMIQELWYCHATGGDTSVHLHEWRLRLWDTVPGLATLWSDQYSLVNILQLLINWYLCSSKRKL